MTGLYLHRYEVWISQVGLEELLCVYDWVILTWIWGLDQQGWFGGALVCMTGLYLHGYEVWISQVGLGGALCLCVWLGCTPSIPRSTGLARLPPSLYTPSTVENIPHLNIGQWQCIPRRISPDLYGSLTTMTTSKLFHATHSNQCRIKTVDAVNRFRFQSFALRQKRGTDRVLTLVLAGVLTVY